MWRIKYYDNMGLVDISFRINDKERAIEYAEKQRKQLAEVLGHEVTYKISKDKED